VNAVSPATPKRRRRVDAPVLAAGTVLAIVALCALLGSRIGTGDPEAQDLVLGLTGPSREHWLGTDELGRDVLSLSVVGARTALWGPALVAAGAMLIGSALGLIAGYRGGWLDAVIMRACDAVYALPGLLIAIVVAGVLGGGYLVAVAVLVVVFSPYDVRIVRGSTLEQRSRSYVEAARALGIPPRRIVFVHIWPNVLPIVVANTFVTFAFALVALSSLSFVGIGVGAGAADWGRMLFESRLLLFDNAAAALAPATMLVLTAASLTLVGDWAYERLADPESR
jgi:peptide/nickel transport system permease protein